MKHGNLIAKSLLPKSGRAHLIGIGGSGMRSLASVLRSRGWQVSGSDLLYPDEPLHCVAGHSPDNVPGDADLVVYSDAVAPENCERRRADQLDLLQLSYPEMLGQLMLEGIGLAVAGTHGKSTTTSMAAQILRSAGYYSTVVCGARDLQNTPNVPVPSRSQQRPLVLVEACEYRANFLHLNPQTSVLLGIEADHFDFYKSEAQLQASFARFIHQTRPGGVLLVNAHCQRSMSISQTTGHRRETFGIDTQADWQAVDLRHERGRYQFRLVHHDRSIGTVCLNVLGRHNVLNALAAAALAHAAGTPNEMIISGLSEFQGIERRLEHVGSLGPAEWIDDYAHHPTEIAASLRAVREMAAQGRIFCVFQPHQLSRTRSLLDEFAQSLQNADIVFISEIYRARETPISGRRTDLSGCSWPEISALDLAQRTRALGVAVDPGHRPHDIADRLKELVKSGTLRSGDVLITMAAGDIGARLKAKLLTDRLGSQSVPNLPSERPYTIPTIIEA